MFQEQINRINDLDFDEGSIPGWMKGPPDSLVKAVPDQPFGKALMLRDGTMIEFEGAEAPSAEWILLRRPKMVDRGYDACSERGIEVRLRDVSWVADAPHGT